MNSISFYGGETTGSVGKRGVGVNERSGGSELQAWKNGIGVNEGAGGSELQAWKNGIEVNEGADRIELQDTVNFRGRDYDEGSSGSGIIGFLAAVAIGIGGLAYAHKSGAIGKIKNPKVQNFAEKIAKPCHSLCSKVKNFGIDCYNKLINIFKK